MAETSQDSDKPEHMAERPTTPPSRAAELLALLSGEGAYTSAISSHMGRVFWVTESRNESTQTKFRELEQQLTQLKVKIEEQTHALKNQDLESEEKNTRIQDLERNLQELETKQRLDFLLSRVNRDARAALLNSPHFQEQFLSQRECNAFVMSVDIRRSTDLMLKARTPELFAAFISDLCSELMRNIIDCYGVFDKFTGDGVLAFFPDFYSGPDAGMLAVTAAMRCHQSFERLYKSRRQSFSSILTNIGLGIGIDGYPLKAGHSMTSMT